ncbi:MAG: glycosyltransferase [Lachnospiraceae bacterium]|nr:glycosyltransferase [Lachnospiraceae bacterium]
MPGRTLTVVVPVYRVDREYLEECFKSILAQTFTDYELVIVDDGAPDDIRDFMAGYDFSPADVKIIRQENAGVAAARNRGIEAASGRYITFIDSDDTVKDDMFEKTVSYAERNGLEVLMWGINCVYPDHIYAFSPYLCDIPHFSEKMLEEVQFKCLVGTLPFYVSPPAGPDAAGSACAKLYDLDFLRTHDLRYTPGLVKSEDMLFNLKVFDAAEHVGFLHSFFYDYRQHDRSASFIYRENGLDLMTPVLYHIRQHLEEKKKPDLYFQVYYMRCMFFYLESMDCDYLHPDNPAPFMDRIRQMGARASEEPYATAFKNLSGRYLTFARKIPLFLIRHRMFLLLALFFGVYRKMGK